MTLYQVTGEVGWLEAAGGLLDAAIAGFADDSGGFFDSAAATGDGVPLLRRAQDPTDNATPSGASAVNAALVTYSALHRRPDVLGGGRDGASQGRSAHRQAPPLRR